MFSIQEMDLNAKLNQFGGTDRQTTRVHLYVPSTFMAGHKKN